MIHFVVTRDSDFGIRDYLGLWGLALAPRLTVFHYDDLPSVASLPGGTWIFSALDQLYPAGRRLASEAADQLAAAGARVVNHPERALRRFGLLDELFRRGLNRHRAVRATGDFTGLRYPVFLREENHHTGPQSPLLHDAAALQSELGRALVRGFRLEQLLVMEFCDTTDPDGYYRKYAAFVVGAEVIPRAMERGTRWALKHSGSDFTTENLDEERAYVLGNPHEVRLREIFAAARVEYGRIDYALKDGVVETWEINLNPTIGRGRRQSSGALSPEMSEYRARSREHFYQRFRAALEAVDCESQAAAIPISFSAETLKALGPMSFPAQTPLRFEGVKKVLRPFRKVLDPVVRVMAPLLGRMSTRRGPAAEP